MLKFAAICPHPPIIIPTIGQPPDLKQVSRTIKGMEKLAERFTKAEPETVIVISPHGPVDFNNFTISNSPTLAGHFYNFGDFRTEFVFKNDQNLIEKIKEEVEKVKIPLRIVRIKELDHGTLVPLYYLIKGHPNVKVVPLAFSYLDIETHFKFGQILAKAINATTKKRDRANRESELKEKQEKIKRVGIVASGDLSHRLTPDAPAGFSSRGKEFDEKIVQFLREKNVKGILNMDKDLIDEAGECGYRSILILLGALDGIDWEPEMLSYEGPFGVGYLVANFKI